jgi:hypothetical protein
MVDRQGWKSTIEATPLASACRRLSRTSFPPIAIDLNGLFDHRFLGFQ